MDISGFSEKFREFLKTEKGKKIGAVVSLLAVLMAMAFVVTRFATPASEVKDAPVVAEAPRAETKTVVQLEEETQTPSYQAVDQYRDPFEPLKKTTNGSEQQSNAVQVVDESKAETLSLRDIHQLQGVRHAVFEYMNDRYTVQSGETIGDSSYVVAEIGETSVTVEDSGDYVVLRLGQEIK